MMGAILALTRRAALALLLMLALTPLALAQASLDPLPSWNEGAAKTAIIDFITRVTREGGADFAPVEERIAVFDNDGTLWSEQPVYFQAAFVFDRIRAMAKDHPEWKDRQPYKAVLEGDAKALAASGEKGLVALMASTHAGMSVADFSAIVTHWTKTARHPRFDRPYTELVFQPMLDLLAALRTNGFKTFIVSGGGVEFMRPWAPRIYGVPPGQIIGSSARTEFRLNGDKPMIFKLPEVEFVDDGPGKPVGINRFIGRRPIFAAGNSDGDREMLQWTTLGAGARLGLVIHHTDAVREWAYDRESRTGRLDKVLDEAPARGWIVVDMKTDWKVVYPFDK